MSGENQLINPDNFERFFADHHRSLVFYALKFVERHDVASDIVQEAFVKLWENRNKIVINASLKAFIYKTVYHLCLNHLEQLKIRATHHQAIFLELMNIELDYYNREESLIQKELAKLIEEAVNKLSPDYKEVVVLSRYQGLKNKEIAEKLKISQRTVETRIYRALNKLRKELVPIAKLNSIFS
ncbi:RNA polymerase sigma-70 factor [Saccharicrinis sp. GN24d3]|uniref:RNA polymerase sigma-70 factor n=1 Tax=Saccharicrinis sp. GN24d3 TaxID=3458416 RepID=UPI00403520AC